MTRFCAVSVSAEPQLEPRPWRLPEALPSGELQLAEQLDLPQALVAVLRRRGYSDPAIIEVLEPAPAPPPEQHFPDLPQAVERLQRAISKGETIAVCGDYDADGMTSTALLMGVVQGLGGVAKAAIPSRMEEGYGLNPAMVERLHQEGVGLLTTVDNGISATPALERAQALGVEVIITDHHAIPAQPPPCLALLHPALTPPGSPYRNLAGVGLAYLLARCLCKHNPAALANSRDLFCIGTVADMAPLHGVNRLWLRHGLARLHQSSLPGLQALIRSAGLPERPLDEEDIGFQLAPRINAVGRLGDPRHVVELLTTPSEQQAMAMAQFCEDLNQQRRELCAAIEAEALALLETDGIATGIQAPPFLLLAQNHWHHGVIGIVAARLMERFGRPVALLAGDDQGRFRASVRAPRWFAVDAALQSCGELLDAFGGHPAAGGFTVASHRVAHLQERLEQRAATALQQRDSGGMVAPEAHLGLEQVNGAFLATLRSLAPFGVGHPAPLFWAHNCRVLRQQALRGGHRRFELGGGGVSFPAIAWRWPHGPAPQQVDVAFRIGWDRRGSQPRPQLEVEALRAARWEVVFHREGRQYWCSSREGDIHLRNAFGQRLTLPWPLPSDVIPHHHQWAATTPPPLCAAVGRPGCNGLGTGRLVGPSKQVALGLMQEQVISKHQGHHGLHHGNSPGQDTGIMAPLGRQDHRSPTGIHRVLGFAEALRAARWEVVFHREGRQYWCSSREGDIHLRNAFGQRLTLPWPLPSDVIPTTTTNGQQQPLHPYVRQLAVQAATVLGLAV